MKSIEAGAKNIRLAREESLPEPAPDVSVALCPIGKYRNWRGIPKPRRCPFCEQAKGKISKARPMYQGVCPSCRATGPRRESSEEALAAWNGKT